MCTSDAAALVQILTQKRIVVISFRLVVPADIMVGRRGDDLDIWLLGRGIVSVVVVERISVRPHCCHISWIWELSEAGRGLDLLVRIVTWETTLAVGRLVVL